MMDSGIASHGARSQLSLLELLRRGVELCAIVAVLAMRLRACLAVMPRFCATAGCTLAPSGAPRPSHMPERRDNASSI